MGDWKKISNKKNEIVIDENDLSKMIDEVVDQEFDRKKCEGKQNKGNKPGWSRTTRQTTYNYKDELKETEDIQLLEVIRASKLHAEQKEKEMKKMVESKKKMWSMDNYRNSYANEQNEDQLLKVLSISQKEEEDRQRAIREEKEMIKKRRRQEFEHLAKELIKMFKFSCCTDSDFSEMQRLFTNFEEKTGGPVIEDIRDTSMASLNGKSSLILVVIHVLKNSSDVTIDKICDFFGNHLKHILKVCSQKTSIFVYNGEKHELDKMSLFSHTSMNDKFVTIDIKGDGNCLWNSVSVALFGDYSMMESLRLLTASTLLKYKKEFIEYLNQQKSKYGYSHELSFDDLVSASTEPQVWGDEIHILALSLALNRPIYSYGSLTNFIRHSYDMSYEELKKDYESDCLANHFKYVADLSFESQTPILLYYNGENHYNVVLPTNKSVQPLIPKSQILEPIINRKIIDFNETKSSEGNSSTSSDYQNVQSMDSLFDNYQERENKSYETKTEVSLALNSELTKLRYDLKKSQITVEGLETQLKISESEKRELRLQVEILEKKLQNLKLEYEYRAQPALLPIPEPSYNSERSSLFQQGRSGSERTRIGFKSMKELSESAGSGYQKNERDEQSASMDID